MSIHSILAVIIEDEKKSSDLLKRLITDYCPEVKLLGEFNSVKKALRTIKDKKVELVFLDIELPNENGFSLFSHFVKPNFRVIFTTAYGDHAIKALKVSALDYLLKPIDQKELQQAVRRYIETKDEIKHLALYHAFHEDPGMYNSKIVINSGEGYIFPSMDQIVWLEADTNYTNIHMADGKKITTAKTLGSFEDNLPRTKFYRISRSAIVNMFQIQSFSRKEDHCLILNNGLSLYVSDRKREELVKLFMKGRFNRDFLL